MKNRTKLILLLALISSTASAYVIKESKLNEDFKILVNKAGVMTEVLTVVGSTGKVKIGADGFDATSGGVASPTEPGILSTGPQSIAGDKTFTGTTVIQAAGPSNSGAMTNSAQTIAGDKTFTGTTVIQAAGPSSNGVMTTGPQTIAGDKTFTGITVIQAASDTVAGLLQPPTSTADAKATQMGLKQYFHNTDYNAGLGPDVSLSSGGGSMNSIERALFIPYQMQGGEWRLKFNIAVTLSSVARTAAVFSVVGVTFKDTAGFAQRFVGDAGASPSVVRAFVNTNTATLELNYASMTTTVHYLSGDVELNAKPTWAY